MGKKNNRPISKRIALLSIFLALALILSYVEVLIPVSFGIPGIKLGLTNILILLALYLLGWREALLLDIARIALSALLFGSVLSFLYSLMGGLLSFLVMYLLQKTNRLHVITVSICGGVTHNLGQLIIAAVFVSDLKIFYYLPVLLLSGFLTGALIGIISRELLRRMSVFFKKEL